MPEIQRCWVCHRNVDELAASVDTETDEEKEVKKQMAQVAWFKTKFTESSDVWRRTIPRDFAAMDFQFVASNAEQFSSIKALSEILDAKKLMLDWLADAETRLRTDGADIASHADLSLLSKPERDSLLKVIDMFEAKWRRTLAKNGQGPKAYASGLDGLKLFDGLEFLIAQGLLYYDIRSQLFQIALGKAASKKPKRAVAMVQVNGYPAVPLCSICETLIRTLRLPERAPIEQAPEVPVEQAPEMAEPTEPEAQTVEAVAVAATEGTEGMSPQVAEIVKKIGPATKEAPKARMLHDHRAKEEWDEVLAQKAKEG